jgi:stearoyl-CoA desaturase (Delta-9 desaturase)
VLVRDLDIARKRTGINVAVGYHRYWSHRAYSASRPLQWFTALVGASAIQGSIKYWVRQHRAHHRHTDTELDPYNINQGFWHAHILWIILKQPRKNNRVDISDLQNDPLVEWQHRNYFLIALSTGWILPCAVAGLGWGDWQGGFLYAGIIRAFLVNQSMFCVNSLAHWLGERMLSSRFAVHQNG